MIYLPSYCVQKEEQGTRARIAFRSHDGQSKSDDGTPLSGRVSIREDLALNITNVQPSDEFVFYCQVTAGASGVGEAPTMLKVFCEFALFMWHYLKVPLPRKHTHAHTHTHTFFHQQCKEFMTYFVTITSSEVLRPSITAACLFMATYFKVAKWMLRMSCQLHFTHTYMLYMRVCV